MKIKDNFPYKSKLTDLDGSVESPFGGIAKRLKDATDTFNQYFGKRYDRITQLDEIIKTPSFPNKQAIGDFQIPKNTVGGTTCLHLNCVGCKNGTCSGIHALSCPCRNCSPWTS